MFARHAISPIEVVGCATFPQELVQSDSTNRAFAARRVAVRYILLDLVKRETEFARRTTWSPAPRVTNSICQRIRYDLRTSAVEPTERVVNTITYVANSICAASTDAPVESRSRSFELHITGPQTPNLDHARQPSMRRTAPLWTKCVIAEGGRDVCRVQSAPRSSEGRREPTHQHHVAKHAQSSD